MEREENQAEHRVVAEEQSQGKFSGQSAGFVEADNYNNREGTSGTTGEVKGTTLDKPDGIPVDKSHEHDTDSTEQ